MKPAYRSALRLTILAFAIAIFARYLIAHPELIRQLARTPPRMIVALLAMYILWFGALVLTVHATLLLCRRSLAFREQTLLNAYSTLVNFFVPGQGGVAVRGLYLKRHHSLRVKTYVLGCLFYYACYALTSALMLLAPNRPWWQTIAGMLLVAMFCVAIIRVYIYRSPDSGRELDLSAWRMCLLTAATLLQGLIQIALYFLELRMVEPGIKLAQATTYAGAANLSLFVALTPGGIGVRESFLLFTAQMHRISPKTIIAASLLDRGSFLLLLGLLALLTVGMHARRALGLESRD